MTVILLNTISLNTNVINITFFTKILKQLQAFLDTGQLSSSHTILLLSRFIS